MDKSLKHRIQVFDAAQEFSVVERKLPHWSQAGTVCFITWRTWDSIPEPVLTAWLKERDQWLLRNKIDPRSDDWKVRLQELAPRLIAEFHQLISDRWNQHLDDCHGACVLRQLENANIVADSLRYADGEKYDLLDFVVMPNHVHVLASFPSEDAMLQQCESWKHFTATAINRRLKRKCRFWQQDGFDHLVRTAQYFDHYRLYIADNPRRARLANGTFVHWSKPL